MRLDGDQITPRTAAAARKLIGKEVTYLQRQDIDRSSRGYFFPRYGRIVDVLGECLAIDNKDNFAIYLPDLVEMVETQPTVMPKEPVSRAEGVPHSARCRCARCTDTVEES